MIFMKLIGFYRKQQESSQRRRNKRVVNREGKIIYEYSVNVPRSLCFLSGGTLN